MVFSDVDCPYCRKFEAELAKVDNITVYTFLYPIEGLHPKAVQMSKQIWCAPDRNKAWDDYITRGTRAGQRRQVRQPGRRHHRAGQQAEGGRHARRCSSPTALRVPGMVPAAQLERLLAANAK